MRVAGGQLSMYFWALCVRVHKWQVFFWFFLIIVYMQSGTRVKPAAYLITNFFFFSFFFYSVSRIQSDSEIWSATTHHHQVTHLICISNSLQLLSFCHASWNKPHVIILISVIFILTSKLINCCPVDVSHRYLKRSCVADTGRPSVLLQAEYLIWIRT